MKSVCRIPGALVRQENGRNEIAAVSGLRGAPVCGARGRMSAVAALFPKAPRSM